jgi:NADH-quinone oxidoreductase subunit J
VLLIAMVGAIVLTLRTREGVRRQSIASQVERRRDEAIEIRKVPSGSGA